VSNIFYVSYISMWILLLIEGLLLLLVYRHFGLAALGTVESIQRDGLPIGEDAVPFEGITAQGESVHWIPQPGRSYLLAFVSPDCGPCERIIPSLLQLATFNVVGVVLVVTGQRALATKLEEKFGLAATVTCLAEEENHIHEGYHVRVTPFAFMIGGDGRILAKGLCDTVDKLQALLSVDGHAIPRENLIPAS